VVKPQLSTLGTLQAISLVENQRSSEQLVLPALIVTAALDRKYSLLQPKEESPRSDFKNSQVSRFKDSVSISAAVLFMK
jgi:hypothetical protein